MLDEPIQYGNKKIVTKFEDQTDNLSLKKEAEEDFVIAVSWHTRFKRIALSWMGLS